jgi:hypothetical protein
MLDLSILGVDAPFSQIFFEVSHAINDTPTQLKIWWPSTTTAKIPQSLRGQSKEGGCLNIIKCLFHLKSPFNSLMVSLYSLASPPVSTKIFVTTTFFFVDFQLKKSQSKDWPWKLKEQSNKRLFLIL